MKRLTGLIRYYAAVVLLLPAILEARGQANKLWYRQPAATWTEALPLGNGRLGAMVFGRVDDELLQLNEATLWSGGPVKQNVNPGSFSYLGQVRDALFKGDYRKAQELDKNMQGVYSESYLPLADLHIKQLFSGGNLLQKNSKRANGHNRPSYYYRELDVDNAKATTNYEINGVGYKREILASGPDQVIAIRITATQTRQLNLKVSMESQLRFANQVFNSSTLALKGKAPVHDEPSYNDSKTPVIYDDSDNSRGMRFELLVKAITQDGRVRVDTSGITIKGASVVTLYLSAATSFNGYDKKPDRDEHQAAINYLNRASKMPYSQLLKRHLADFHHYFNRVSLTLNENQGSRTDLPTDERLVGYNKGGGVDPGLEALYFQYGRYLLISSSRTAGVPANLQGIWNKDLRPPWSSNYTSNINLEMNYWMAEDCNLPEMHQVLTCLIKELSVTGAAIAREFYHAPGWVAHHNTDIWALANPVGDKGKGDPKWANWPMGGDWLVRHLWEHYLFTRDKEFLKETAYPLMKGAARFTLNWLIPDSSGHLVTAPSMSPENDFIYAPGKTADVSISTTMDLGIIRDLFDSLVTAEGVLGIDAGFRDSLLTVESKLIPYQIGSKGQLQEWFKDFESPDPHHRHVSHLYSVYPANEISVAKTPELAAAARRSLELRGDESTGWSLAWKVNLWARLLDGNHAYKLYRDLLRVTGQTDYNYSEGGGLYLNMFDAHPPFQIDGNFGGTAGVAEMLLQSQDAKVHLLPALPAAWATGEVKGLVARGAFVVSIKWRSQKVVSAVIHAKKGGTCKIVSRTPLAVKVLKIHSIPTTEGYELEIQTVKNKNYLLTADSK